MSPGGVESSLPLITFPNMDQMDQHCKDPTLADAQRLMTSTATYCEPNFFSTKKNPAPAGEEEVQMSLAARESEMYPAMSSLSTAENG